MIKKYPNDSVSDFYKCTEEIAEVLDKWFGREHGPVSDMSDINTFVPQGVSYDSPYLTKVDLSTSALPLPTRIKDDIVGVINSINHNVGINKFLSVDILPFPKSYSQEVKFLSINLKILELIKHIFL